MAVAPDNILPDDPLVPPLLRALAVVLQRRGRSYPVAKNPKRRPAGVLLPFYLKDGELHLVCFRRTEKVPTHRGQVAFPGGSGDADDKDLRATALRESREELGIDPAKVVVLGALRPFDTFVSNFVVSPFCGFLTEPNPAFKPQPFEVAEIFEIPLVELRKRINRHRGRVPGFNVPFPLPYYRVGEAIIWGATGSIVADLLECLDRA